MKKLLCVLAVPSSNKRRCLQVSQVRLGLRLVAPLSKRPCLQPREEAFAVDLGFSCEVVNEVHDGLCLSTAPTLANFLLSRMSPTYRSGPLTSAAPMFVEIRRGKFPLLLRLRSEASSIFDERFKTHRGATGIDVPGLLYWKWAY